MSNILITFYSTHYAIKAEREIKKKVAKINLIPTPREISSECGFSLLVEESLMTIKEIEKTISYEHTYKITLSNNGDKKYEKVN